MLVFCCCSLELSFLTLTNRTLCLFGKFFGHGLVGVAQKGGGRQVREEGGDFKNCNIGSRR